MAINAKLFVDEEYYNLKEFEYGFVNGDNANGFSSGKTRQTGLTCVIEAIRQEYFEEWAMENHFKKYVEVHISHGVNSMGRTRILKCHDTFLLELHTRFSSTSHEPMTFELFMKSGAIEASWSTASHVEPWSELPIQEGETTVIEEELEPRFLGYHLEDGNGNEMPQTKIKPGEKIVLVIETENAEGDTITIDLDDDDLDYEYNGSILRNDVLEGISITGEQTRVELKAVKQN